MHIDEYYLSWYSTQGARYQHVPSSTYMFSKLVHQENLKLLPEFDRLEQFMLNSLYLDSPRSVSLRYISFSYSSSNFHIPLPLLLSP